MKTYILKSTHEVFTDSYEDGEGKHVNGYVMSETVEAENWESAVDKYLSEYLGYNLDIKNCELEDNILHTSCLVDGDNLQPSGVELHQWKNDKLTLYSNHIEISVYELTRLDLK